MKSHMLLFSLAVLCISFPISGSFVNPDVIKEEGIFICRKNETHTYTVIRPEQGEDLWIFPLVAHSPHLDTSNKDNKMVEKHRDFVEKGYTIAAIDYGNSPHPYYRGYNTHEEAMLMVDFAKYLREKYDLDGYTYISGGSHSGWITLLALELGSDVFDGGISNCGVTYLEGQESYGRYNLIFSLGTLYYKAAHNYLVNLVHSAVALQGPPYDRKTETQNKYYNLLSPALKTEDLATKAIIVQGDSDIVVPPFSLWEFVDPLTSRGSKDFIGFSVPAEGHGATGKGYEYYYGDLYQELINWVEGNPIKYEPGETYGDRDDWIPSPSDIWEVEKLPNPSQKDLLKLKHVKGLGSNIGKFANKIVCEDVDKDGKMELIYGTLDGFIEVLEWSGNRFKEEWRSKDFGTGTFAVDVGDLDEDGILEIVASDDIGTLRVFKAYKLVTQRYDDFQYPVWDIFVEDLNGDEKEEVLVRTIDGYLYLYEGIELELNRREWIGPALASGMTVSDTDNDGVKDIIIGNLSGYLIIIDGAKLNYKWGSGYLSAYPMRIATANVQGDSTKEIFMECSEHGNQDDSRETLVFHGKTYSELKRFKTKGNTYGFCAKDIDDDGYDEIVIGSRGFLQFIDTPNSGITWNSPIDDSYFSGVVIEDLDFDGKYEIIATSAEGSIYVFDTSLNLKWKYEGFGAPFGIEVVSGKIVVGTRTGQIRYLDDSMRILKNINLKLWPHAIEADDIDNDGKLEIVVGTGYNARGNAQPGQYEGYLIVLDAKTGKKEWSTKEENGPMWGLCISDVDNDGTKEIVVGNRITAKIGKEESLARVYVYGYDKGTYKIEAEYEVEGHDLYLDVGDCDLDGMKEIVIGDRRGYVTILKGDMKGEHTFDEPDVSKVREWLSPDLGTRVHGIEVIPGEIILGNEEGTLYSFSYIKDKYKLTWKSKDLGSHLWGILVKDINGDNKLEIVTGNGNGSLFIFDHKTKDLLYRCDGLGSFVGIYNSIESGDIDGDNREELIVGSSGYLYVFDVSTKSIKDKPLLYLENPSLSRIVKSMRSIFLG